MLISGTIVEILPAYNHETGCRDIFDEVARCDAKVVQVDGFDVLVYIRTIGEAWLSLGRIKMPMPT